MDGTLGVSEILVLVVAGAWLLLIVEGLAILALARAVGLLQLHLGGEPAALRTTDLAGVTLIAAGVPDRQIATIGLGHTTLLRRVLGALLVSFALLLLVRILTPLA